MRVCAQAEASSHAAGMSAPAASTALPTGSAALSSHALPDELASTASSDADDAAQRQGLSDAHRHGPAQVAATNTSDLVVTMPGLRAVRTSVRGAPGGAAEIAELGGEATLSAPLEGASETGGSTSGKDKRSALKTGGARLPRPVPAKSLLDAAP